MRKHAFVAAIIVVVALSKAAQGAAPGIAAEHVTAAQFGPAWPLRVGAGEVRCAPVPGGDLKILTFKEPRGRVYALNGIAESHGESPIDPIWADNPESPGAKKNIGPLIDKAKGLCR